MKTILSAVAASLALSVLLPAQAWANPQHERMKRCNAEAKTQALKGEERKAFMSTCLKGKHEGSAVQAEAGAGQPAPAGQAPEAAKPVAAAASAPPVTAAAAAGEVKAVDDQARATACNQSATEQSLKGAKRKAFVSECLKG
ncbi:PsiF family protein [Thauera chlorobenzoica]|uniref:PsiF-like protein n=1 Tax=Thauera chlorobenzoica TaxID=96773 RepID=A0A1H5WLT1_9RHOO|nr:PsiF family protein [Thauera chlorobenzoica]APR04374.1 PsiF-like protein [Thauera chlorobenzoica]SEG00216.1 psiF repeat-containing protein [Thauera chlorobenzoica]